MAEPIHGDPKIDEIYDAFFNFAWVLIKDYRILKNLDLELATTGRDLAVQFFTTMDKLVKEKEAQSAGGRKGAELKIIQ